MATTGRVYIEVRPQPPAHTHVEGPLCAAWDVETDPLTLQYGGADQPQPGAGCHHNSCWQVVMEPCLPCDFATLGEADQ